MGKTNEWHVNPATGAVSRCTAKYKCEFSESTLGHYPTDAAARAAFEESMKATSLTSLRAVKPQPRVKETYLSDIMDTGLLKRMIDDGFVYAQVHPEFDNLKVLTYSKMAQITGRWNDATVQARGLILDSSRDDLSNARIMERPWRKFFTLQQMTDGDDNKAWALGDEDDGPGANNSASINNLDFDAAAEVSDKMDGSLGILYTRPDGKLAMATKGSFASPQALQYTEMLNSSVYKDASEELKSRYPDTTFLYELVGKSNQIVLDYDKEDIVLLGAVDKSTGLYHSTTDYTDVWSLDRGLATSEIMQARNITEALAIPDRPNREGVVIRVLSDDPSKQMQVKVKQADYVRLHRLMNLVSKKGARDTIRESKASLQDILEIGREKNVEKLPKVKESLDFLKSGGSPFHKRIYTEQLKNFEEAILPKAINYVKAYNHVANFKPEVFEGDPKQIMKDFAESIQSLEPDEKGALFSMMQARLRGQDLSKMDARSVLKGMASSL